MPFTPGGSNDVVARELAAGFQARWGQSAVVENRPGGGGAIAYSQVAKSPPDGHLLLIAPVSFTMIPHLSRNAGFDPLTDYAPINMVADVPFVMVVPPTVPARTVKEFIALAKTQPGQDGLRLGRRRYTAALGRRAVQDARRYRSDPCAVPGCHRRYPGCDGRAGPHVHRRDQLAAAIDQGRQAARAGRGWAKRIPALPDVPTWPRRFAGFEVGSGVGLVAPAGTPAPIIDTLYRATAEIIATPGFHQRMAAIGVDVVGMTPAQYAKIIRDDYEKWGKVVQAAGIKPE